MNRTKFLSNSLVATIYLLGLALSAQPEAANEIDKMGRKQGTWAKKYENGKIRYQGQFVDDQPVGTFFYYSETGAKNSEVHYQGNEARTQFYHDNGTVSGEGVYVNQKKEGEWKFYDNQSVISAVENYKNGRLNGSVTIFFINGKTAATFEYKEGLKNGPFKEYFESGITKIEGTYLDNNFDGEFKQFYSDGMAYITGQYKAAVKDGLWIYYATDGRVQVQQVWQKGKLIKEKFEDGFKKPTEDPVDLQPKDILDEKRLEQEFYRKAGGR